METIAKCCYLRISAQKLRLVANAVRGIKVNQAFNVLRYINKKSAFLIIKVLDSAVANAEHNNGLDVTDLKIVKIYVDNGPSMKRIMPRAKGRSDRIIKRTSHLTIVLSD